MTDARPLLLIVCGGRHHLDRGAVFRALDTLSPAMVIEGQSGRRAGATIVGVDLLAGAWCQERGIPYLEAPALWRFYEKQGRTKVAGPVRNKFMAKVALAIAAHSGMRLAVAALPGAGGTKNMKETATAMGFEVIEVMWNGELARGGA